jgi:CIC family chloride channel protein
LRGETIRSAADVGWLRELTVRRMMRSDVRTVPVHTSVSRFRMVFPLGSVAQVVAVNEDKEYAGLVYVAEAHAAEIEESTSLRSLLHFEKIILLPTMTVKEAVATFDKAEAEVLAVVQSLERRQVVGLLSESYALRRYADELELRRRELIGE